MEARSLVVGESLVDAVQRRGRPLERHPGGSPANVALTLARLGRPVDLLTWLGQDADGRLVADHLTANGVSVRPGHAERTPLALATIDDDGSARYTFDLDWRVAPWRPADPALVVHTGSIATTLEPGGSAVVELLEQARSASTITYDPNLRPAIMGSPEAVRGRVATLVALADVVKVSDEDLAWLEPDRDDEGVLAEWAAAGPSLVVLTRGGAGALAIDSTGRRFEVGAPGVEVVDTVGAGDSFMGALIDGLWSADVLGGDRRDALARLHDATLRGVLDRCARVAAVTVSRAGADPPRATELG